MIRGRGRVCGARRARSPQLSEPPSGFRARDGGVDGGGACGGSARAVRSSTGGEGSAGPRTRARSIRGGDAVLVAQRARGGPSSARDELDRAE